MTDLQSIPEEQPQAPLEPTNILVVSGQPDRSLAFTELRMADGQIFRLPTHLLYEHAQQSAYQDESAAPGTIVIPVVEEQLEISKRVVATGTVRIRKTVEEYKEQLDEPLNVRTYDIERTVLNRLVESAPPVRQEGDTTIYPVVEEQMVLTKQLILKEELRVTKRDAERHDVQVITLLRENVVVEREAVGMNK